MRNCAYILTQGNLSPVEPRRAEEPTQPLPALWEPLITDQPPSSISASNSRSVHGKEFTSLSDGGENVRVAQGENAAPLSSYHSSCASSLFTCSARADTDIQSRLCKVLPTTPKNEANQTLQSIDTFDQDAQLCTATELYSSCQSLSSFTASVTGDLAYEIEMALAQKELSFTSTRDASTGAVRLGATAES